VSRWTRASIASSLCALSLLAAGCGGGRRYDAVEVEHAFAAEHLDVHDFFGLLAFDQRRRPVRPLSTLLQQLWAPLSVQRFSATWPEHMLQGFTPDITVLVYDHTDDARNTLRAQQEFREHLDAFNAMGRRLAPPEAPLADVPDFDVTRSRNVVVTYPPSVERRVRAALDRLD
jgi:hypothetical protein